MAQKTEQKEEVIEFDKDQEELAESILRGLKEAAEGKLTER